MTYIDAPIDSADARERREAAEQAPAAEAHACVDGWLGDDDNDRPIPCPRCRPHLLRVPCWLCSTTAPACQMKRDARRGPCCGHCQHSPAPRPKGQK